MRWFRPGKQTAGQSGLPLAFIATIPAILIMLNSAPCPAATTQADKLSKAEILRLGERMYLGGILPSGKLMNAVNRADVEVNSSVFSCASCHLRAGLGSYEGGVVTPPTTGIKLYKSYRRLPSIGDVRDSAGRYSYAKSIIERPAYTRESLARALRFGTDSAGQPFNEVMPRYPLSDDDMAILINYLELLSAEPSPGASSSELKFATIITEDVSQEDRQALLRPLQAFIENKNKQYQMYNEFLKTGFTPTADMIYAFRQASLDIWELKGPPETWQKQLADFNTKSPVFSILGGISNSDWAPIHDFCETQRIPCLFPITDFPVTTENGWYTYYYNKGFAQEGEAAAHYINRNKKFSNALPILQIVQDSPSGKALATGFMNSWSEFERPDVITLTLSSRQISDHAELEKLIATYKPGTLILWTDASPLSSLLALDSRKSLPQIILMSSGFLGKKTTSIPESLRDRVFLTYPYRLTPYVGTKDGGIDAKLPIVPSAKMFGQRRIATRTTAMLTQVVLRSLYLLYDNLYRDNLMDIMGTHMDMTVMDYERFSFGQGQRYVSKGCYIIQLGKGADPALLQLSDWVIH